MKVLLIVDVQNDFCPGGALAVPEGDAVVPIINRLAKSGRFDQIIATQDWHPVDHLSFASQHPGKVIGDMIELNSQTQVLWPDHCVQGTPGAELVGELDSSLINHIFQKGQRRQVDSYSGFYDNDHQTSTGLGEYLKEHGASEVYICGLATDYCVKFSALDALTLGFKTYLIEDASRGVNLSPDDSKNALNELKAAGASIVSNTELI